MLVLRLLAAAALAAGVQGPKTVPGPALATLTAPSPLTASIDAPSAMPAAPVVCPLPAAGGEGARRAGRGEPSGLPHGPGRRGGRLGQGEGLSAAPKTGVRARNQFPPHPSLSPLQGERELQREIPSSSESLEAEHASAGRTFDASAPANGPPVEADAAAAPPRGSISRPIHTFRLANGLTVVVQTDRSRPIVAGSITYKVGSQHERRGRSGFYHLVEHTRYKGSKNLKPHEFTRLIESSGGEDNAETTKTETTYYWTVPKGALDRVLWAEAEGMRSTDPDPRGFAIEKRVVIEELRRTLLDAPYLKACYGDMGRFAFKRWANAHEIIGTAEDVDAATLGEVKAFHRKYYRPDNAVLALVGDVTLEEAKRLVGRHFGSIPARPAAPEPDLSEPPLAADVSSRVEDPLAKHPALYVGWRLPERGTKAFAALRLLSHLLGAESGPFQRALSKADSVLEWAWSSAWWGNERYGRGADLFGAELTLDAESGAARTLSDLDGLFKRLARLGPGAKELARAKTTAELQALKNERSWRERAQTLSAYTAFTGSAKGLARDMRRLLSLRSEDIRRAVKRWIVDARRVVMLVVPKRPGKAAAGLPRSRLPEDSPRRPGSALPPLTPAPKPELPRVHRFSLANGMQVRLIRDPRLPLLEARLLFDSGLAAEGPGRRGLAKAASELLLGQTKDRDARGTAELFQELGYEVKVEALPDSIALKATGLARNAGPFFKELAEILRQPAYPADEVEDWRALSPGELKDKLADPEQAIEKRQRAELFRGHAFADTFPRPSAIAAVARGRLRAFHRRAVDPSRSTMILVGDLTPKQARRLLESAFHGGPSAKPSPPFPPAAARPRARFVSIPRPGAAQVHLSVSQRLALSPADPDYMAVAAMNTILGVGGSGRLFENLRNDHGYAYRPKSRLIGVGPAVTWQATVDCRPAVARRALGAIRTEARRIREDLVSPEELEAAKRRLAGKLEMTLSSPEETANALAELLEAGLDPETELASRQARLDALTREDVRRVARRYLDPDRMLTIALGDPAALKPLQDAQKAATGRKKAGRPSRRRA